MGVDVLKSKGSGVGFSGGDMQCKKVTDYVSSRRERGKVLGGDITTLPLLAIRFTSSEMANNTSSTEFWAFKCLGLATRLNRDCPLAHCIKLFQLDCFFNQRLSFV